MQTPTPELRSWLAAMPKAELHLHLDGSLRPATALELASDRARGLEALPTDLASMRQRLVAPERCIDQAELLRAFELPVALLQDEEALERVAVELVEDVSGDGTVYAEIRWAPSLHLERGLSLDSGIAAVVRGTRAAAEQVGIEARLIAVILRTHDVTIAQQVAEASLRYLGEGLTGLDIAGIEREAPDPRVFAGAVEVARDGGLGITCHAGEWGGPERVWQALEIEPWRIAHGAPAAEDDDLMTELRERGVTLDICPTSSRQIGIGTDDAGAPLPRLVRAGVPVTISTDDRTVSNVTLIDELERAMCHQSLSSAEVAGTMRQAFAAAFLHHEEELRAELQQGFETWLAQHAPGPL